MGVTPGMGLGESGVLVMGEYMRRKSDGERIKVGTCEDLYYLRCDQLGRVYADGDANPRAHLDAYRFRFPWPEEDGIAPGDFKDYERSMALYVDSLPELEHGSVQFTANYPRAGYVVSLPCPEGPSGSDVPYVVHRNGFAGNVRIVQQAVREGGLVTIGHCGGCGSPFRFPDLESVQPVLDALETRAESKVRDWERSKLREGPETLGDLDSAERYREIARRIVAGYEMSDEELAAVALPA